MKKEDEKDLRNSAYGAYAIYGAAGIQLAASVVAGLLFGNYLDGKIGTRPWLALLGITLGFIGGIVNLIRIVGWFGKRSDRS